MPEKPVTEIEIVCRDASHEGKTVKITRFARRIELKPGGFRFHPSNEWVEIHAPLKVGRAGYRLDTMAAQQLVDDRPVGDLVDEARWRYPFKCEMCRPHRNVPVRDEKLQPILDKVAEAGEASIDLRSLAAILRKLASGGV